FQSGSWHIARRGDSEDPADSAATGNAAFDSRSVLRITGSVSTIADDRAVSHFDRNSFRLYRARNSLREPDPSSHDSVHASFGKPGSDSRLAAYGYAAGCNVHHRHHSADRNRQEERDHDDRLRA